MRRLGPYISPALLGLLATAGVIAVLPVHGRVKLFLGLLLLSAVLLRLLARWSKRRPAYRRAFFIGLLFGPAVLLAGEVGFAYLDWLEARASGVLRKTTEFDPQGLLVRDEACSYRLRPSRELDLWGGKVRIDQHGFRNSGNPTLVKEPGRTRIILVGGSTAFGWGVPDGQELASHLRTLLNADGTTATTEVINAAVPYYTSFHELNLYLHVLHAWRPDVLVVLHGRNDAHFAFDRGNDWRPVWEGMTGPSPFIVINTQTPQPEPAFSLEAMLKHSALYRRYDGLFPALPSVPVRSAAPESALPDKVNPAFIEQFARHRDLLARAAVRDGCRCIFALQPVIDMGKRLTAQEQRFSKFWGNHAQHYQEMWPQVQAAASRLNVEGAIAVDLTDLFAGFNGDAYLDECHYTNEGNRLIAERLAGIIRSECAVMD